MDREQVRLKTQEVLRNILDDDTLVLADDTAPKDTPNWSSLNHIQFILTLESTFGIEFSSSELERTVYIGDIIDQIMTKTAKE